MTVQSQEIVWIGLEKLLPHPQNANVMGKEGMRKLRRHIKNTGRYEPLVVRKHPTQEGCFELINGHHRKRVLENIGETRAACLVWQLSDAEALMLLATINRLGGEDAAGKRLDLIEALSKEMQSAAEDLAGWLPEDEQSLKAMLERDLPAAIDGAPALGEMDEPFTVFLKHDEKKRLVAALKKTDPDPAKALLAWSVRFTGVAVP